MEWTSSEEGVQPEVRYFMSSLDLSEWKSEDILSLIRDHWLMKSSLHFAKDRRRDEDRHYLSMQGLGERFTCLLNRAAVTALVRDKSKKFLKRLGSIT